MDSASIQAAGIIVYRLEAGRALFLLLRNAHHGTWGFPKGHCRKDEALEAAARRETLEETGIESADLCSPFHKTVRYTCTPRAEGGPRSKAVHYFLGRVDGEDLSLSAEHSRGLWLDRVRARETLQFDTLREVLDCAHSRVGEIEGIPSPDGPAARALLDRVSNPGEMWRRHSREVARASGILARALLAADPTLPADEDWIAAAALLHDIGRCRSHGFRHPLEGFRLLGEEGLGHLAKPCISHWLKGRSRGELEKDPHFSRELLDELFGNLDLNSFTLSDKIIALADSLVMHDRLVTVDARYHDADERYGSSTWMRVNRRISLELLDEFEGLLGRPVYDLLGIPA